MHLPYQKQGGCFTLEHFLRGRNLIEMERLLGFREGRLLKGASFYRATVLPELNEFELAGYTQIPTARIMTEHILDKEKQQKVFGNVNYAKLKELARETWCLSGRETLIKVKPVIPHSESETYPEGLGVPQWIITVPILCKLIKFIEIPQERYYSV